MKDFAVLLAVNAAIAVVLLALIGWIRSRSPMNAAGLRRRMNKAHPAMDGTLPCMGRLEAADELQRTVQDRDDPVPRLTALMLGWLWAGAIDLRECPKLEMRSFGAAVQPQIDFLPDIEPPRMTESERLFWELLHGWAGENGNLQEGELYNFARADAAVCTDRLTHLRSAGRHALREIGASHWEEKRGRLFFRGEKQEIYSPKGVRMACGLQAYRTFCDESTALRGEQAQFAVLLGSDHIADRAHLSIAWALAEALTKGAAAGMAAQKRSQERTEAVRS